MTTATAPAPFIEQTDTPNERPASSVKILIVVEGTNDVEFLRRISRVLNADDPAVPDLAAMEHDRDVIFLPIGGSDHRIWSRRLAPLGIPEFHLYDRDLPPRTQGHEAAVQEVNRRQGCIAAMTSFRHLENYLHPQAIHAARKVEVEFGPDDDLSEVVAQRSYAISGAKRPWGNLPSRKRRQLKQRAKHWLNTQAVNRMTPALLDEQDAQGDIRSWLEGIDWLIREWA